MAEDDFKERANPAYRGRVRARLEDVSSDSGEQAGAPSSAGAPVESRSCLRCGRPTRNVLVIFCDECERGVTITEEQLAGDARIPTGWRDLVQEHPERYVMALGFAVFHKEKIRWGVATPGPQRKGILDEDVLMHEINVALVNDLERLARVDEIASLGRNLTRSEVRTLRELLIAGVPRKQLNTEVVAAHYGIKPRAARELVRAAITTIGWRTDSMPLTKADMNELREELEERYEALHADVRATLAVVLERFPDSNAVAAAVDEFLDGTLGE